MILPPLQTPRGDPSRTSLCLGNSEAPTEKEIQAAMVEAMGEVMARSYTSWLSWWKNTVNSDDYMKYASAQVQITHDCIVCSLYFSSFSSLSLKPGWRNVLVTCFNTVLQIFVPFNH